MPKVKRRMQLNVGFDRKVLSKKLKLNQSDDEIIFPTVWFEQSVVPKKFFEKQVTQHSFQILQHFPDDHKSEPDHLHAQSLHYPLHYLRRWAPLFCPSHDQFFRKSGHIRQSRVPTSFRKFLSRNSSRKLISVIISFSLILPFKKFKKKLPNTIQVQFSIMFV